MNKTSLMIFISTIAALSITISSPAGTYLGRLFYAVITFVCVWVFLWLVSGIETWFKGRRKAPASE